MSNPLLKTSDGYFKCQCGAEILHVTRFEGEDEYFFALYSIGQYNEKPSIWERLKYCWYHLKTGKIYGDEIVLSSEDLGKLSEWINEELKKKKTVINNDLLPY